jgi:hypothetical protein
MQVACPHRKNPTDRQTNTPIRTPKKVKPPKQGNQIFLCLLSFIAEEDS